ncbi:ATP-binding cassette domain-containing protein, partial [Kineococcus glutinatus]|uniref:ATP-binding cassette domain-containing protein n=1 Tax=Kineococcus glutinatus TaxID=1070872 RepID=UPI0031EA82B6
MSSRYGRGPWVLRGADLHVAAGEVVWLQGDNGSGKSTLLRVAVGAGRASAGVVRRRGPVGYQPQTGADPPPRVPVRAWLRFATGAREPTAALDLLAALGGPAPADRLAGLSGGSL